MDTIWDADLQSAVLKAKDHRLKAERLSLGYEGKSVCDALDLAIPHGKFSVIVGPNGCGKSTLLKSLCRLLKPLAGQVLLDGQNIHQLPTKVVAKQLGLLPQSALTRRDKGGRFGLSWPLSSPRAISPMEQGG